MLRTEIPTLQAVIEQAAANANARGDAGWSILPEPELAAAAAAVDGGGGGGGRRQLQAAAGRCTPDQITAVDRCVAACECSATAQMP